MSLPETDRRATLIIVSNRLPYNLPDDQSTQPPQRNVGGLVNALEPVLAATNGSWVGWDGHTLDSQVDVTQSLANQRRFRTESGVDLWGVPLSKDDLKHYYFGLSNRALWPLYHNLIETAVFSQADWESYKFINRRFAETAFARAEKGDRIWVHDYHLTLVPQYLRDMGFEGRIDFFLHIPFPALEILRAFPWREEMINGLLGADAIAFHINAYRDNFSRAVKSVTGVSSSEPDGFNETSIAHNTRGTLATVAPIGIDVDDFERISRLPDVEEGVKRVHRRYADLPLIFCADRLDYTKGIINRMLAVERFLERHPERAGSFTMLQVVVPSRAGVEEYRDLKAEIDGHVGRINGAWNRQGWLPIHYEYRAMGREELVTHYRAASAALITPLRDGMNLVASEFVASRTDGDGVLILSEFAGVAEHLSPALQLNPYDLDGSAETIRLALDMQQTERRERMASMRDIVRRNPVSTWAENCLGMGYGHRREWLATQTPATEFTQAPTARS
jgi:trehalose 6-phosphate synthase/phosphatase